MPYRVHIARLFDKHIPSVRDKCSLNMYGTYVNMQTAKSCSLVIHIQFSFSEIWNLFLGK